MKFFGDSIFLIKREFHLYFHTLKAIFIQYVNKTQLEMLGEIYHKALCYMWLLLHSWNVQSDRVTVLPGVTVT